MQFNPISQMNVIQEELVPPGQEGNSINLLPVELIDKILAHLPPSADRTTSQVCKLWNLVVQKLPDPTLIVFGKEAWKDYYNLEVEEEAPPLPKKIYQITRSLRRSLEEKKEELPCTAILMPKGLTLNKLRELMKNPVKGNSTKFRYIWNGIIHKFGDEQVKKSYWFVITNDVIEESRNKNYVDQTALVRQKTRSECELPKLLEVLACCAMHHVSSGKYLFRRDSWTYTGCQEQVNGITLVVGGFASGGPLRLLLRQRHQRRGGVSEVLLGHWDLEIWSLIEGDRLDVMRRPNVYISN